MDIRFVLLLASLVAPSDTTGGGLALRNIAVHRQPALPIVSLRMSLRAADPLGYAGAGHLLQHLVFPVLRAEAERVGGDAQIARSADALVYTVSGPADELQHLASALRAALRLPADDAYALAEARRELTNERNAEAETAAGRIRAMLRRQLFPDDRPAPGTATGVGRLDGEALRRAWAQMYHPDRVFLVAVGDVQPSTVERAFGDLPAARDDEPLPEADDSVPTLSATGAQATRAWLAVAYPADSLSPVAVAVASRLLRDRLRDRLPSAETAVEQWWTHRGQGVVVVAALAEAAAPRARRVLDSLAIRLQDDLDANEVRIAAVRLRRDMLFHGRTPTRMAELIGGFVDRSPERDPVATQRFWDELERVDLEAVVAVLRSFAEETPHRAALPAQKLTPARPPARP